MVPSRRTDESTVLLFAGKDAAPNRKRESGDGESPDSLLLNLLSPNSV